MQSLNVKNILIYGLFCLFASHGFAVEVEVESKGAPAADLWIGVMMTEAIDGGVKLVAVAPNGPAAEAGLEAGDILVEVEGDALAGSDSLKLKLATLEIPITPLEVQYFRKGNLRTTSLRPEPRPSIIWFPESGQESRSDWSLRLTEMTPELRRHYGAPEDRGLLVLGVSPGVEGLQVGDIITEACETPLTQMYDWQRCRYRALASGTISLERMRKGTVEEVSLSMPRAESRFLNQAPGVNVLRERIENKDLERVRIDQEIERLRKRLAALEARREELSRSPD